MNTKILFRPARRDDLPDIVRLLAEDPLGSTREQYTSPLPDSYYSAFNAIDDDSNNELMIADLAGKVIGVLQLTYIPYITYQGSWRALIEGVRVDSSMRSSGVGRQLFEFAIQKATDRGCHLVQLTSDKTRPEAIRFYESLGFVSSHEGLKLHLLSPTTEPNDP